ncbi:MAG: VWA domain-containing protein [Acidobacteria bacterium]|nr:VWA domain-containing protein [Acidobacteriota bacterium]
MMAAQSPDAQDLPPAPSAAKQQQQASPTSTSTTDKAAASAPTTPTPEPAPQPSSTTQGAAVEETPKTKETKPLTAAAPDSREGGADPGSVSSDSDIATIRRTVNEVNVVFTVTDKHGHYVRDLKQDDFNVLDDKKAPREIRTFHRETDLPLQVGLLIDASNSVRDRFRFEQEAAIEFLNQLIRPGYDKAFVIGFDTTPEVTQDFTDNTELLSRGVRALRAGGGTAMYDALYFACRDKLLKAPRAGPVRRAVILLSDGQDNQSRVTREEAIEMSQRAEVIVYTISTNISGIKQSGDKVLERIAEATGGRAFFPFQMTDVANEFAAIQDELRSQYLLAYIPDDFQHDGRYRTIEIVAHQKKQFHVRARRGYFAPSK